MTAMVYDGGAVAQQKEKQIKEMVERLGRVIRLATVVFEEDENSLLYTRLKQEAAVRVGIQFSQTRLSFGDSLDRVREVVEIYNQQPDIDGILIQKPEKEVWRQLTRAPKVGSGFRDWWRGVTRWLEPEKDVDCLTEANLNRVMTGGWQVLPATVRAVIEVLWDAIPERVDGRVKSSINLTGLRTIVVGRSDIVGRPLAMVMAQSGAEVKLYGSDLDYGDLSEADVVVSATGVPNLIKGEMIKDEAIVVDVGTPKGDVEFESVVKKAGFITPVPNGVGPMTVACLLDNTVEIAVRNS